MPGRFGNRPSGLGGQLRSLSQLRYVLNAQPGMDRQKGDEYHHQPGLSIVGSACMIQQADSIAGSASLFAKYLGNANRGG